MREEDCDLSKVKTTCSIVLGLLRKFLDGIFARRKRSKNLITSIESGIIETLKSDWKTTTTTQVSLATISKVVR
jgi:hypothetical protein